MEIRLLRYFLAVAREENITRAAESLHISQPSLSKQLMELEQEVGKQLLIRGKRKITLTQDGIGGSPTTSILKVAAAVRTQYPDIRFQFYSSDATDVLERLEHGSLDFAVLLEPVDTAKYEYHSLGDSARWGLLLPEHCPLSEKAVVKKEDIRDIPLIFHHRMGLQQELAHWAQTEIEQLNIAATYNVVYGDASAFVQSGLGYLLVTDDHLPKQLNPGL